MIYSGATHDFLHDVLPDEDFRADIFSLVDAAWSRVKAPRRKRHEPRITGLLQLAMIELGESRYESNPPFSIREDVKIRHQKTGKEVERMDLGIWLNQHYIKADRPYFVFEAKKLNTSEWESNAYDYVGPEGMAHLLAGGYQSKRNYRGMLAFVMDGNVPNAKQAVEKQLANKARELNLDGDPKIRPSEKMPRKTPHGETHHKNSVARSVVYHMFLSVARKVAATE